VRPCAAGGNLVLAGILERQADELKQAYAPYLSWRWPTAKTAGF
jgi:ribosomal protein L11 methylase PrmA